MENNQHAMHQVINGIHNHVKKVAPELIEYFHIFANEALFARAWLNEDLLLLPKGSQVLEVGAGLMLLSAILQYEGWKVTALEPVGQGFSEFKTLQHIIIPYLKNLGIAPKVVHLPVEDFKNTDEFDYAFSVNVMEHIENIDVGLTNVIAALKPNSSYRFTCANYHFPYETHFNIPTFFSKKLTERLLGWIIFRSKRCKDPVGTWNSLNWINVRLVKRISGRLGTETIFNKEILFSSLQRVVTDNQFSARRSGVLVQFIKLIVFLKLHHLTKLCPEEMQPLMDCKLIKI